MDLALILGVGAIVTLIFRKIKQPIVLGYIIAGLLIGPHMNLFPSVADEADIKTLADIGVIFLLFGLGLEFSFKKLMHVGAAASVTAMVEIVFICLAGYMTGMALGWSQMDCLFLGGMLASSSTTIIIKAFDELGIKTRNYARVVFGVLVVEDIVVILLMVLLSTVAVTQHFEGTEMLFTVGKLFFFLIVWFIFGIYLIPTFLKKIQKLMDDEGYLILSVGLCLGMVVFAVAVGFSAELGAFIMGSILAETTKAEHIERIIKPVKDLFGTIFFVSVGMMIDPMVMVDHGWTVLAITLLVIFGKVFSTTLGAVLSGQGLKQAIQVGMSMAQIGEFAFIVATLGMSLGVISDFLFPVAVGASAITTFTTPYMIKYSDKVYTLVERVMPNRWMQAINTYTASAKTIRKESDWKRYIKSYVLTLLNNGVILLALFLLGTQLLMPFAERLLNDHFIASVITFLIVMVVASPFIWALVFRVPKRSLFRELWTDTRYNRGPLLVLGILRPVIVMGMIGYFVHALFSAYVSALIIAPVILLLIVLASRYTRRMYEAIVDKFMTNLNSREISEAARSRNRISQELMSHAREKDMQFNITDLEIGQTADYAGKSIEELRWDEEYGINIVYIKRGEELIYVPGPKEKVLPFDHVGIIASDEQIERFMPLFNRKKRGQRCGTAACDVVVEKIRIGEGSVLSGLRTKNARLREMTDGTSIGMVIGIERGDEYLMNPGPKVTLQVGDVVWIVGMRSKLEALKGREMEEE